LKVGHRTNPANALGRNDQYAFSIFLDDSTSSSTL